MVVVPYHKPDISRSEFKPPVLRFFGMWSIVLGIAFFTSSRSQEVIATATVDSTDYLIGDWINLTIEITRADTITVTWPTIGDSLKGFEIITHQPVSLWKANDRTVESSALTLTAYDSGNYAIPPLEFRYRVPGDTAARLAKTSPLFFRIRSIPIDATQEIKDIKRPLAVPISLAEVLLYVVGVVLAAGLAWFLYYILKKRRKGERVLPSASPRPAHEIALEELRILGAERLWQRGKVKEYHSRLTEIVRTHIERRFGVTAMEMTSDEILASLQDASLDSMVREKLREILIRADLVKFAKVRPLPEENEASLALASSFVESSRPEPESVEQEGELKA